MTRYKSNKTFKKGLTRYLPVLIILLSITIMVGSTFAYFNSMKDKSGTLTFSKVELSSETSMGVNGQIRDVIPGTKLVDGDLSFAKSIDSEAMYVRAKIAFSLPAEYKNDQKMIELLEALRLSSDFNVISESQHGAVWSNKVGNYYYLLDAGDTSKLKRVDTIDTYTLASEIVVPYDLEQLEDKYQYMKTVNFHVAFEAIQADNVSDTFADSMQVFNVIFPEEGEQIIVLTITQYNNDGTGNIVQQLQLGDIFEEPVVEREGYTLDGWYTKDGSEDGDWGEKVVFPLTISESISIYAKWDSDEKIDYTIDEIYWVGETSVNYSGNPVRPYLQFNDSNIVVEYTYLRDYGDVEVESTPIDAGSYIARAVLRHVNPDYKVTNNVGEFLYTINPIAVSASRVELSNISTFTYNGEWQTPVATNLPSGVNAIYNYKINGIQPCDKSIDAHDYELNVTLVGDNNHIVIDAPTLAAHFTIEPVQADMSGVLYDWYFDDDITAYEYTGKPVKPVFRYVPDNVHIEYVYTDIYGNVVEEPTERGTYYVDFNLDSPNYNFTNLDESLKNYRFVIGGSDVDTSKLVWNVEIKPYIGPLSTGGVWAGYKGVIDYTGSAHNLYLTNNTGLDLEITYEGNNNQVDAGYYSIVAHVKVKDGEQTNYINNLEFDVNLSYEIIKDETEGVFASLLYNGNTISGKELYNIEKGYYLGDTFTLVPNAGYVMTVWDKDGQEVTLTNNTITLSNLTDFYSVQVFDTNNDYYVFEHAFMVKTIQYMKVDGVYYSRNDWYKYNFSNIGYSNGYDNSINIELINYEFNERLTYKYELKYLDNENLSTVTITDYNFVISNLDQLEYIVLYYEANGERVDFSRINIDSTEESMKYMGEMPYWFVRGFNLSTGKVNDWMSEYTFNSINWQNYLYTSMNYYNNSHSAIGFGDYSWGSEMRDYTIKLFTDEALTNEVEFTNLNLLGGELYMAHYNLEGTIVGVRKEALVGGGFDGLSFSRINNYVITSNTYSKNYSFQGVEYTSKVAGKDSIEVQDKFTSVIHKVEIDFNNDKYIYEKPIILIKDSEITNSVDLNPHINGWNVLDYFETGVDTLSDIDLTQIEYFDNSISQYVTYEFVNIYGFNFLKIIYDNGNNRDVRYARIILNNNNSFNVGATIKLVSNGSEQVVAGNKFSLDIATQSLNVTLSDTYANAIIYGPDGYAKAGATNGVLNYRPTSAGKHTLAIVSSNDRNVKYYTFNVTGEIAPVIQIIYKDNELKQYLDGNNIPNIGDFTFETRGEEIVLMGEMDVTGDGFSVSSIVIDSINIAFEGELSDGSGVNLIGGFDGKTFQILNDNGEHYIYIKFVATNGQVVNIYIVLLGYETAGEAVFGFNFDGKLYVQYFNSNYEPSLGDFTFEQVDQTTMKFEGSLDITGVDISSNTITYDMFAIMFPGTIYDGVTGTVKEGGTYNSGVVMNNVQFTIANNGRLYNLVHFIADMGDYTIDVDIYIYLERDGDDIVIPDVTLFTITYNGEVLSQKANANQEPAIGDFVYERLDEYNIRLRGAIDVAGETFTEPYIVLDSLTTVAPGEIYDGVTMNRINEFNNIRLKIDLNTNSVKLMFKTLTNPTYTTIITLVLKNLNIEVENFVTVNYRGMVIKQNSSFGLPTQGDFDCDVVRDTLIVLKHDLDASKEDVSDGYITLDKLTINTTSMIFDYVGKGYVDNNASVNLKITSINDNSYAIISTASESAQVYIVFRLIGIGDTNGGGEGGDEQLIELIKIVYGGTTLSQSMNQSEEMSGDFNVETSDGLITFTATLDVSRYVFTEEYITLDLLQLNTAGRIYDGVELSEINGTTNVRLRVGNNGNYYACIFVDDDAYDVCINIILDGYTFNGDGEESEELLSMTMNGNRYILYSDGSGDFTVMYLDGIIGLTISLDVTDELIMSGIFTIDSMTINFDYTRVYKMVDENANQETVSIDNPFTVAILNYADSPNMYLAGIGIESSGGKFDSYIISINFVGETLGTPMDGDDNVELILSMDMNGGTYAAYTDGSGNFIYYGANNEGALMIDLYVTDALITSGTFTIDSMYINQPYTGVAYINAEGTQNPIIDLTNINVDIISNPQTNQYMSNILIMNNGGDTVSYYVSINFIGETLGSPMGGNAEEAHFTMSMLGNTYNAYTDGSGDFTYLVDGDNSNFIKTLHVSDAVIQAGKITIDRLTVNRPYTSIVKIDQNYEMLPITSFEDIELDIISNGTSNGYNAIIIVMNVVDDTTYTTYIILNLEGDSIGVQEMITMTMSNRMYVFNADGSGDFDLSVEGDYTILTATLHVTDELILSGEFSIESLVVNFNHTRAYRFTTFDGGTEDFALVIGEPQHDIVLPIFNAVGTSIYLAGFGIENIAYEGNSYFIVRINFIGETLGGELNDGEEAEEMLSMSIDGNMYTIDSNGNGSFEVDDMGSEIYLYLDLYVTDTYIDNGVLVIDNIRINMPYNQVLAYTQTMETVVVTEFDNINVDIIGNPDPDANEYASGIMIICEGLNILITINLVGETLGTPITGNGGGNENEFADLLSITMDGNTYTAFGDRQCDFIVENHGHEIYLQINIYVTDEYITNGVATIENMVIYIPYNQVLAYTQTMETVVVTEFDNINVDIIGNPEPDANEYLSAIMITGDACNIYMTINFVGETLGTPVYDSSETEEVTIYTMVIDGIEYIGDFEVHKNIHDEIVVRMDMDVSDDVINSGVFVIDSLVMHIPYFDIIDYCEMIPISGLENINLDIVHHHDPQVNKYIAKLMIVCENVTIYLNFNFIGESLGVRDDMSQDELTHIQISCRGVELYKNFIAAENRAVTNLYDFVVDERTNTVYYYGTLFFEEGYEELETITIDNFNFNFYSPEDMVLMDEVSGARIETISGFEVGVEHIDGKQVVKLSVEYDVDGVTHRAYFEITLRFNNGGGEEVQEMLSMTIEGTTYSVNSDGSGNFIVSDNGGNVELKTNILVTDEYINNGVLVVENMLINMPYTNIAYVNSSSEFIPITGLISTNIDIISNPDPEANQFVSGIVIMCDNMTIYITINFVGETLGTPITGNGDNEMTDILIHIQGNELFYRKDSNNVDTNFSHIVVDDNIHKYEYYGELFLGEYQEFEFVVIDVFHYNGYSPEESVYMDEVSGTRIEMLGGFEAGVEHIDGKQVVKLSVEYDVDGVTHRAYFEITLTFMDEKN